MLAIWFRESFLRFPFFNFFNGWGTTGANDSTGGFIAFCFCFRMYSVCGTGGSVFLGGLETEDVGTATAVFVVEFGEGVANAYATATGCFVVDFDLDLDFVFGFDFDLGFALDFGLLGDCL